MLISWSKYSKLKIAIHIHFVRPAVWYVCTFFSIVQISKRTPIYHWYHIWRFKVCCGYVVATFVISLSGRQRSFIIRLVGHGKRYKYFYFGLKRFFFGGGDLKIPVWRHLITKKMRMNLFYLFACSELHCWLCNHYLQYFKGITAYYIIILFSVLFAL